MDSDDATILAKSVDMEFGDFEEEPKQHVSKRLTLLPPSEVTDVAMVVADAIKATLMAVKEELAADRAAAHASNSHVLSLPSRRPWQSRTPVTSSVSTGTL